MFMVSVAGLAVENPASVLATLTERMGGFLPEDAVGLLTDYIDRTLRGRSSGALLFAVLLTLGSGSAASQAVIKAANRAYEVRETRPFRRIWTISMLMISGFVLLVVALALVAFSPEIGGHVQRRSEEHTSELQSRQYLVCRLLLGKKKNNF